MPRLKNQKHEEFARAFIVTFNATEAARAAGYAAGRLRQTGHEVLHRPDVQARLLELTVRADQVADITVDRIAEEARRIATSDIRDVIRWGYREHEVQIRDAEGKPTGETHTVREPFVEMIPSDELTAEAAATIAEVSLSYNQFGPQLKLKREEKGAMLNLLAKWKGMLRDIALNIDPASLTDEQLSRMADGEDPTVVLATPRQG